jgi:hypothetical protein
LIKASIAESGNGPPLYPESFRVSLNRQAAITEILDVRPEEVTQTYKGADRFDIVGSLGRLDHFEFVFSGLDSFQGLCSPRYETSLLPKMHLSRLILM